MLTQNSQFVKLNMADMAEPRTIRCMAESGGHDPQSPRATVMFIRHTPTLWDSLSNHKFIIALHHKKTTVTLRSEGGTTYREETSYAYRFLEAAQKG